MHGLLIKMVEYYINWVVQLHQKMFKMVVEYLSVLLIGLTLLIIFKINI